MYQSDSLVLDAKFRSQVLENWNRDEDKYRHPKEDNKGGRIDFGVFPYEHSRSMPKALARRAHDYIRVLTKVYPFQLRYAMGLPLWNRFCEEWCDTGDEAKALGAI